MYEKDVKLDAIFKFSLPVFMVVPLRLHVGGAVTRPLCLAGLVETL